MGSHVVISFCMVFIPQFPPVLDWSDVPSRWPGRSSTCVRELRSAANTTRRNAFRWRALAPVASRGRSRWWMTRRRSKERGAVWNARKDYGKPPRDEGKWTAKNLNEFTRNGTRANTCKNNTLWYCMCPKCGDNVFVSGLSATDFDRLFFTYIPMPLPLLPQCATIRNGENSFFRDFIITYY